MPGGTMVVVIPFWQKLKQKTRKRLQMEILANYMYFVGTRTGWPDPLSGCNTLSMESCASLFHLKSLL